MSENSFPGPMTMVRIDGAKIKRLREQQGLTQLYVATGVEVTTDTISRWENKRYPSIKRENGLKLAETLGVCLEDLLEDISEQEDAPPPKDDPPPGEVTSGRTVSQAGETVRAKRPLKAPWSLSLALLILLALLFFFWFRWYSPSKTVVSAVRIAPEHCLPNRLVPILIEVTSPAKSPTALILKEQLPENAELLSFSPAISGDKTDSSTIRWLGKINGNTTFAYNVKFSGSPGDTISFSGTSSVSDKDAQDLAGTLHLKLSSYHWADENLDNVINDKEILTVYDRYSDIAGLEEEIDLVEEIWLGSGYRWHSDTGRIEILD
ncbi:helix-turn-helix transcriptional regulator [Desulforhopalus singaporensis]|uniref:DNA-binding transcriptional regulator, XRE-family HTH domain n=1 Tax=Desulforhopalus singaporensis TaxID=91360 RepID=A0A1H0QM73_9BACT|nr:helix-turn-helix transcriptional regulator [Desulforhopalus singaporensis]SDP18483.1 DNA-binding transcriptional regulator, XRE-family HTH domain [Desulforhopalus singaporensis]